MSSAHCNPPEREEGAVVAPHLVRAARRRRGERLLAVALLLSLLLTAVPRPALARNAGPDIFRPAAPLVPASFQVVAENDLLRLYMDPRTTQVIVEDRGDGHLWTSNPVAGITRQRATNQQQNAVFMLDYTGAARERDTYTDSVAAAPAITLARLPGGVAVRYDLTSLGLSFQMVYHLGDDFLEVTIPSQSIQESDQNAIIRIEPLPFFGATTSRDAGYFVVPDGPGALLRFNQVQPEYRRSYKADVYGPATLVFGPYSWSQQNVSMPLFGEVVGDDAFAAIVTKGAFDARIVADVAHGADSFNTIAGRYVVRRTALYPRSRTRTVARYERARAAEDFSLRYRFLQSPNASYVGIARAYRDYLTGDLRVPRVSGTTYPLHVRFFMGIQKPAFPFPNFIQLTDYDQVIQILDALKQRGVGPVQATLVGWEQGGYGGRWPLLMPPDSHPGGPAGLQRLAAYCRANGDRLVLQAQYTWAVDGNGGFSARSDVVRGANRLPVQGPLPNSYVLNPIFALRQFVRPSVKTLADWGVEGILIPAAAELDLVDRNQDHPLTRSEYADAWRQIISTARQTTGWVGATGANAYALGAASHFADVPLRRNNYDFFEQTVPLMPLALHGLVTYSTTPANLQGDQPHDYLRQLEYGAVPTFELTYSSPQGLEDTTYASLFSSQYQDWLDTITREYQVARVLDRTRTEFIANHEQLAPDVFVTTFEDGTRIVVNYGDGAYQDVGALVPPGGYTVAPVGAAAITGAGPGATDPNASGG